MKVGKMIKRTLIGISVLVLLIVLFVIWILIFFPNETVRKAMEEELTKQFHRKVVVGYLDFSILHGITIKNFIVYDRVDYVDKEFLKVGKLSLSYKLLPLLKKELVIKEAVLSDAKISVVRFNENGKPVFNFEDIFPLQEKQGTAFFKPVFANAKSGSEKSASKSPIPQVSKSSIPVSLNVSKVGLENATLKISDLTTPKLKKVITLGDLNGLIEDINFAQNSPMKLKISARMTVEEYKGKKKLEKEANIKLGIDGKVVLFDDRGLLNPTGELYFYLRDGYLNGRKVAGDIKTAFEILKKEFIEKAKKAYKDLSKKFKTELKSKVGDFKKKALADIDKKVKEFKKKVDEKVKEAEQKKNAILKRYDETVGKYASDLEKKIKELDEFTRKTYNLIFATPELKKKYKLAEILKDVQEASRKARAKINALKRERKNLEAKLNAVINEMKKMSSNFERKVKLNFNKELDKYLAKLDKVFKNELNKQIEQVEKYNLKMPFMEGVWDFKEVGTKLKFKDQKAIIDKCELSSPAFKGSLTGWVGFNQILDLTLKLTVDKKYNVNEFTAMFQNDKGDVEVALKIQGKTDELKVSLVNEDKVKKQMIEFAKERGKKFIKDFIARKLNLDSLLGSIAGGGKGVSLDGKIKKMDDIGSRSNSKAEKDGKESINIVESQKSKIKQKLEKKKKEIIEAEKKKAQEKIKKSIPSDLKKKIGGFKF